MSQPIDVAARTARVSMPAAYSDFPVSIIPAKGVLGSAKGRVSLRMRTPDNSVLVAKAGAKGLQRALEAAQADLDGYWISPGRLAPGGVLAAAGVIHEMPAVAKAA